MFAFERKITIWYIAIALAGLAIGSLFGPLQAFEKAGLNLYPSLQSVGIKSYYQGLTLHGVLNALVWTTFFIVGFLTFATARGLKRELKYPWMSTLSLVLMVVGLVSTAIPILFNKATVLYTFYPPLKAHAAFYIGLTLVVIGSWVGGYSMLFTYFAWRKENPGTRTPFITFASLITMVMWQFATLGVAAEMLFLNIPWALGILKGTDPQLARTLFWFTGHPLVYFWLLPAYISWYGLLPRQAGGKLFSDSLARLAFWLFLLLSIPVGFHHQFVDPGVPAGWKLLHAMLTYGVFLPSMMTAFTVIASLERAARARGGKGLLRWILALPWGDPSVTAQLLAAILFLFGGIGGLINASYSINLVIHNTSWVPGHFHLTVGTAVTLSFMGMLYWLLPHLTNRPLWSRKVALAQAWTWFVGMAIFSDAMHFLGLLGMPRRTFISASPYVPDDWDFHLLRVAIGGGILFVSGALFFANMVMTVVASKKTTPENVPDIPIAEAERDPQLTPNWLDRWRPWVLGTTALVILSYGPTIFESIRSMSLTSLPFIR